jgi:uncharacterized protein YkwD
MSREIKQTRWIFLLLIMAILLAGFGSSLASFPNIEDFPRTTMVSPTRVVDPTSIPTTRPSSTSTPLLSSITIPSEKAPTSIIPTATTPDMGVTTECSTSSNSNFEAQVINLINQERTENGLPVFATSSTLSTAARGHSVDMACHNFASHTGSNGSFFGTRLTEAGFTFSLAAENIAAGYHSPFDVVKGWLDSPGHLSILLNPDLEFIGVGYAYYPDSTYGDYWTADFGTP